MAVEVKETSREIYRYEFIKRILKIQVEEGSSLFPLKTTTITGISSSSQELTSPIESYQSGVVVGQTMSISHLICIFHFIMPCFPFSVTDTS